MASIDGLGSGLDTSTIISQLMSIEKLPQQRLAAQRQSVLSRATAWGQIDTALKALGTALGRIETGGLAATRVTSSNLAAATVSRVAGTEPTPGVHTLEVTQLATAQRIVSGGYASPSTVVGEGALVLSRDFGSIATNRSATAATSGTYTVAITAATATSVTVSVNGGTAKTVTTGLALAGLTGARSFTVDGVTVTGDSFSVGTATLHIAKTASGATVRDVAAEVAKSKAPVGAVVIDNGSGTTTINITGTRTGSAANLTAYSTFSGGLAASTLNTATTNRVDGVDAKLTVNGTAITRAGNTVADVLPGLSFGLVALGTTKVTVESDGAASAATGKAAVDSLNAVLRQISTATKYDLASRKSAALTGDSGARTLASRLTAAVSEAAKGVPAQTLSAIGLALGRDGLYSLDSTKLEAALAANPEGTTALVQAIAARVKTVTTDATGTTGVTVTSQASATERAASLQKQVEAWDGRLALVEARLRRQFTALDTALGGLKNQGTWLAGQIAGLQRSNS